MGSSLLCRKPKKTFFYIRKYLVIFIGALIAAAGLELFLIPNNVIDGGVVGISIMMKTITGLGLGLFMGVLNLPFLYLGWKQIGRDFALTTAVAIAFLSFWSGIFANFHQVTTDPFLAAIFGGIIDGIGVGLIIRNGGSLDGTEIVAIIMDRKSIFSVGEVVMFINLFILSSAGLLYGWDKAMYSLVAYFVISKMIDVVQNGFNESYAMIIVTSRHEAIARELNDQIHRGVTFLHGEGSYTGEAKEVLYCVVTRLEVDRVKEIVLDLDESAFITVNAVHDIIGGRFNRR